MYMCACARVLAHTEINVFEKELLTKQTKTKQTNERVEDITKKKQPCRSRSNLHGHKMSTVKQILFCLQVEIMSFASFLYRFLSFSLCVCLLTHMRMNVCIVVYTCVWRCTLMGARGKCQMSNFVTPPPHLPEASSLTEPGARLVASKLRKSSCLLPTPTSHTLE